MMNLDLEVREFLIEGNEYVAVLDRDILALEDTPDDPELISSAFRAIHTIKGTCGFFGYDILGSVTHLAENILSQVREHERLLTSDLVSLILETLDAVKILLNNIEVSGTEGADFTGELRHKLETAAALPGMASVPPATRPTTTIESIESAVPLPIANSLREPLAEESAHLLASPHPAEPGKAVRLELPSASARVINNDPPRIAVPEVVDPEMQASEVEPSLSAQEIQGSCPYSVEAPTEGVEASDPQHKLGQGLATEATPDATKDAQLADSTIRVDVALLNRLMNLVGELVLARNQLLQEAPSLNTSLQQTSQRLNLITSELQEGVMKTRMQPIGVVWNKLPRVVRDLAAKCGKRVRIEMEGADTELDKTIIEAIKDPLTHIVRNSCDHGIETPESRKSKGKNAEGVLLLRAYHEGGVVNIEISDDGAGIDPQRVKAKALEKGLIRVDQAAQMTDRDASNLIFLPGFSTAAQITSVSGRGVGMDVVKTNIEKIGGHVELLNRTEGGTTIRIKIPLTLAIIPGLVIGLGPIGQAAVNGTQGSKEERFIIPQANLLELVRVESSELKKRIENVHGTPVFHHRGKLLPLVYLGRVLQREEKTGGSDACNIIVLQAETKQLGLVVDRISDTQEIVVKPLGRQLKGLTCYVGATIMGDGRPALILDVAGLAKLAGLGNLGRQTMQAEAILAGNANKAQPQMMLLFRAGQFARIAVPLALVDRLEDVPLSRIESSGGKPVLHYRGEILALVSLGDPPSRYGASIDESAGTVQIIVFTNGSKRIGLLVDRILDIVNEPIEVRRQTIASGLLGSAVIGGKITDLLDLHALVRSLGDDWLTFPRGGSTGRPRVMLIDKSFAARELLGEFLTASGFEVAQVATVAEAATRLRQQPDYRALLVSTRSSDADKVGLIEHLRDEHVLDKMPVVELLDGPQQVYKDCPFAAQVVRSDCAELLEVLSRLLSSQGVTEVTS